MLQEFAHDLSTCAGGELVQLRHGFFRGKRDRLDAVGVDPGLGSITRSAGRRRHKAESSSASVSIAYGGRRRTRSLLKTARTILKADQERPLLIACDPFLTGCAVPASQFRAAGNTYPSVFVDGGVAGVAVPVAVTGAGAA